MSPWKRTYWAVFAANLITAVGMMSFLPFFPSLLEEMGLEDRDAIASWAGACFGAAPFAAAVMGPIWGSIGDRLGRKAMVLRAMLAISLFVGAIGFVREPWQLLVLRVCQGVFSGFVPPSITLVSVGAPRAVQGRVAGSLQAALALGSIVGPLLGAWVQELWGIRAIFFVVSSLSLLGALLVGVLSHEDPGLRTTIERFSPTSVLVGVWEDLRALLALRAVRRALLVLFCVQLGLGATNPLLELYVGELGFDPGERRHLAAWLFTVMAAGGVVATPVWGRLGDRFGHGRVLVVSSIAATVALLLHALATFYALLFAARVLAGLSMPGPNACAFGVAATETSAERRGGAVGAVFSARALAVSVGAIGGGALASVLGLRTLFALAALPIVAALFAGTGGRKAGTAATTSPATHREP